MEYLCEKGADIDAKNKNGCTALMWAVWTGHLGCVKCLCEQGADIDAKDKGGKTALEYAQEKALEYEEEGYHRALYSEIADCIIRRDQEKKQQRGNSSTHIKNATPIS